jgi:hypothetical protein
MGPKGRTLIIAGIAVVVCAGIFALRMTKSQRPSGWVPGTPQAQGKRGPFRSAVVELTFQSRSLNDGVEFLSTTGHRTEYIDVAGGRRREDYSANETVMDGQLPSNPTLTWIFDGSNFYMMVDKDGKRINRVVEMHGGFDYPIWADAMVEKIGQDVGKPLYTITEKEFLGRPCKVYSNSKGADSQKWWVWNGVTLRSESHQEIGNTILETSEEAVRVDQDADIDSGLFTPPSDVTFDPVAQTPSQREGHRKSPPWVRMGPELELFWF